MSELKVIKWKIWSLEFKNSTFSLTFYNNLHIISMKLVTSCDPENKEYFPIISSNVFTLEKKKGKNKDRKPSQNSLPFFQMPILSASCLFKKVFFLHTHQEWLTANSRKIVKKLYHLHTAGDNVKWHSYSRK